MRMVLERNVVAGAPQPVLYPPMPAGDARPGRPAPAQIAEVVDPNPARRSARAEALRAAGYVVVTCPGPLAGTMCPAVGGLRTRACARFPADVVMISLDAATARTGLPEIYRRWAPAAELVTTEEAADAG